MKVKWEYEGKQYVISGHREHDLFLNKRLCNECHDILKELESGEEHKVNMAKEKAKNIDMRLSELYDHGAYIASNSISYNGSVIEEIDNDISIPLPLKKIGYALLYMACFVLLAIILYIIYKIWWFFIGDPAFEGPFAEWYTAEEVFWDTFIFIIVLIVVIEEVIRRIMNGHF